MQLHLPNPSALWCLQMESAEYEGALEQAQAAYDLMLGRCMLALLQPGQASKLPAAYDLRLRAGCVPPHCILSWLPLPPAKPPQPALLCCAQPAPCLGLLLPAAAAAYFGPDSADAAFHGIRLGISLAGD
jgi:hypothetical protein